MFNGHAISWAESDTGLQASREGFRLIKLCAGMRSRYVGQIREPAQESAPQPAECFSRWLATIAMALRDNQLADRPASSLDWRVAKELRRDHVKPAHSEEDSDHRRQHEKQDAD
jgi:hypothetical protein